MKIDVVTMLYRLPVILGLLTGLYAVEPQAIDQEALRQLVQDFKKDERGPYQAIRWFCPDGTILPPKERCPQPGGIQHALEKDIVQKLARENNLYLGQILSGTDFARFFDSNNQNSRLMQYQMEKFLQSVDNGWILRRAKYYRGAVQVEDEEHWGENFIKWLATQNEVIGSQYMFLRQIVRDIPHQVDADKWQLIRGLSMTIADSLPSFMNLRVKIHGQPEESDLADVEAFYQKNSNSIPADIERLLQELIENMRSAYRDTDIMSLQKYLNLFPASHPVTDQLQRMITADKNNLSAAADGSSPVYAQLSDLLWLTRTELIRTETTTQRLLILDLSLDLERILFRKIGQWCPLTLRALLNKNYLLAKSAAGCGFLEIWEWEFVEPVLNPAYHANEIDMEQFGEISGYTRRIVEWSAAMLRKKYEPVIDLFGKFEPLALGFVDDRIRSSTLLALGSTAGELEEIYRNYTGRENEIMGNERQIEIRGVNPGYAAGQLEIVTGDPEEVVFAPDKIYFLLHAPANMKPVAGIATVTEGNLVSHIQLLARNLGIPNAVISEQSIYQLLPYSGQKVFYAVTPGGVVILKLASKMTMEEKRLVELTSRSEERIYVPVTKLQLDQDHTLDLGTLRAKDSGRICGPKAANLGELKYLFPDKVVDGLVIPFGLFRKHLAQPMPGTTGSYWQFLQEIFTQAPNSAKVSETENEKEKHILSAFEQFRSAIKNITFLSGFKDSLSAAVKRVLGTDIGKIPVFIRSDTNMEDLKDFTGAGLNLTVFNVVDREKIFQAIRDVWASPYTERSYRWRQKYLLNPENVYPSILIIPTVDVEKSGVMITTGVSSSNPEDITIAFNRGAGGAVEGQMAESYLLTHDQRVILISPAREPAYISLPANGGVLKKNTYLNQPILSSNNLKQIRKLALEIKKKFGDSSGAPLDVEFGFKDEKIWLFQVRPYVESKRAHSSAYLRARDSEIHTKRDVKLDEKIN
jgi:hypothetical protein